ncbi:hypothetical protein AbraCBS73388_003534 [Aspergillus brasiliensis]|uniref:Conidiation-specific protein 10 n=1 Tax=Aspergillus brasiliensis TaxID=319629 RepID=A0A9W6DS76_9EURO|nr:hypothetical protein AbraCBS73388_003534 [Aspergillus brasiliensis]
MASKPNPGNFANVLTKKSKASPARRNIASMGGQASSGSFQPGEERAREAGHKGGMSSGGSFEPGDNRARVAGRKGGSRTGGDMPEE